MRRKKTQPISDINVVPYLDVLLVLLVIFMITAPLFNQGIIDVPQVGKSSLQSVPQAALEIQYKLSSAQNSYTLVNHENNETIADLNADALLEELEKYKILYPEKFEKQPIILAADNQLTFQKVFDLVGILRDNGYTNIALEAVNKK